ncbi:MAG: SDR family oxidoreductase [Lentisphaerae bacterium]|nr:MAG: SDR family oxidoreductase [Lentisphaerota bacterium]
MTSDQTRSPENYVFLRVPKLYANMDEATIGEWLIEEGDTVETGQMVVELVTDKATEQLPVETSGKILKILAPEKSVVPVGYILAVVGEASDQVPWDAVEKENRTIQERHLKEIATDISSESPSLSVIEPADEKKEEEKPKVKPRVAPAARVLAKKHGIDPLEVARTLGKHIIHRQDIEHFLQTRGKTGNAQSDENATEQEECIFIAGASGDIGSAIVKRMAKAGKHLILHAHSREDHLLELTNSIDSDKLRISKVRADLTVAEEVQAMFRIIDTVTDRLDVMIFCVGVLSQAPFLYTDVADWERGLRTNLTSAFLVCQAALERMVRQRKGKIILLGSDAADLGAVAHGAYAAAKAGLAGLMRTLAREFAMSGIEINMVSPGFIESTMTAQLHPTKRKQLLQQIPQRRFGTPAEVAEVVALFAEANLHYVTGQIIHVDGGMVMP